MDDMLNIKDIVFMSEIYKHEKRWYDDMSNILMICQTLRTM